MAANLSPDNIPAQDIGVHAPPPPPPPPPPLGDIQQGELAIKFNNSNHWLPLDEPTMKRVHYITGHMSDELRNRLEHNQQIASEFLSKSLQLPNLALLAGSGTSLGEPKGPSMSDLWAKCMFVQGFDNPVASFAEQLHENARDVCNKVNYTDLDAPNIEHFLSTCDAYLTVYSNDKMVKEFLIDCKKRILKACSGFLSANTDISAYTEILRKLARRRTRDPRLKVFTTNYDMCFETACSDLGMMVVDGFSYTRVRRFNGQYFNFDVVNRATEELSFIQGVIQLYKLHGSVSWEYKDRDVYEVQEPAPESACLIYPAKGKYQQAFIQPHLELLSRYLEFLRQPNACLVVSGFGFNDDHLSEPILSAIRSNPSLKLIVADYAAYDKVNSVSNHYWNDFLTCGADVTFINASFKQLARLIPNLAALSPAEQLSKNVRALLVGGNE